MSGVSIISGLKGKEFKELLSVRYAVSKDKNRPLLNGVLFYVKGGRLYAEALDGYRMSLSSMECNSKEGMHFIVPTKALVVLSKVLKVKSVVSVYVDKMDTSKHKVKFMVEDTIIKKRGRNCKKY